MRFQDGKRDRLARSERGRVGARLRVPARRSARPGDRRSPAPGTPGTDQRSQTPRSSSPSASAASSSVVWNASSSAIISSTRSSELRPSSSSVVSGVIVAAGGEARDDVLDASCRAATRRRPAVFAGGPALQLAPLELLRALGARQRLARPDRRAPDALVIFERRVGAAHDRVDVGARLEHEHRVDALFAVDAQADHAGVRDAGLRQQRALDVFGEDVEALRRDDHFLLAALDEQPAGRVELADVAGVEPAVLEAPSPARRLVGAGGLVVAGRDVVAADEDLAVGRDLHLHAADRRADRALRRAQRMVERDDRRRLGEAVALHDEEAELAPERFELRIERRGAADDAPELPAEQPMDVAVAPPAPRPVLAGERIRLRA